MAAPHPLGTKPFQAALDEKLLLARYFHREIQALGFEAGPKPDLSVVTFRWSPPGIGLEESNRINQEIVDRLRQNGRVFLSSTLLDGRFNLRMAALAFRTHRRTIDLALRMLKAILEEIKAPVAPAVGPPDPGTARPRTIDDDYRPRRAALWPG